MPDETRVTTSRRSILAAALGAAAAWAATAFGRPSSVRAGVDGDVVLGAANTAGGVTVIDYAANDAIVGRSHSAAHSGVWGDNPGGGYGVSGSANGGSAAGVWGSNSGGIGVKGSADTGVGVSGTSNGNAVVGKSTGSGFSGVWGFNAAGGFGVFGSTNSATNPGVYATNDGAGPAVLADSKGGPGIIGTSAKTDAIVGRSNAKAHSGIWGDNTGGGYGVAGSTAGNDTAGVWGSNSGAGTGVLGSSDNGIGVNARSANGVALSVAGKAQFSRSGKASVPASKKSIKVTLGGVSSSSLVFANLATLVSGRYVAAVVAKSGSFTIYLNGNVSAKASLVWFVLDK